MLAMQNVTYGQGENVNIGNETHVGKENRKFLAMQTIIYWRCETSNISNEKRQIFAVQNVKHWQCILSDVGNAKRHISLPMQILKPWQCQMSDIGNAKRQNMFHSKP